ncbi:Lrp/AsnC ligand binding domain-containing protein [Palleronia sp. LCG004]|uniref:Lrp/AsnC ligand binding domain-containing protein n=1 Tax=Palleronia sp. LCG004 TaxID=3079304 RepID=UPI002942DFCE|nr:Lrp/AsnC ligand binding domain-containing protein [Palleronia sp. LCG004]WOI58230.1 Lrp/AsnC ligand binding domain-containing protein [Palleronia sp. LCG004]
MAVVQLRRSEHDRPSTAEYRRSVETTPGIPSCHTTTGADDVLLIVAARDPDDDSNFVDTTRPPPDRLCNLPAGEGFRPAQPCRRAGTGGPPAPFASVIHLRPEEASWFPPGCTSCRSCPCSRGSPRPSSSRSTRPAIPSTCGS